MLTDTIKYSGIYAKTCALNATLLNAVDYERLASCESVKEFAEALGEIPAYKESAAEAIEYGASRVAIERSLLTSLYGDFAALYGFITDHEQRKYLDAVFMQYVLEIIKRIIRRIYDHRNFKNIIPKYGNFLSSHAGLNFEKIAVSEDINTLYENVKGSEIHALLTKINPQNATLFDYETHLDISGIMKRHKEQERLKGASLAAVRRLNGVETDLRNIVWIYRAKEFYDIPNDKLFTYLIPAHYALTAETIRALAAAKSPEEFSAVLAKTRYKGVFTEVTPEAMETDLHREISSLYEEHRKTFSLMSVIAHLYFKRREINNLTALIECVRYKRSPQSALKRLSI